MLILRMRRQGSPHSVKILFTVCLTMLGVLGAVRWGTHAASFEYFTKCEGGYSPSLKAWKLRESVLDGENTSISEEHIPKMYHQVTYWAGA